jgi:hypothetical protein
MLKIERCTPKRDGKALTKDKNNRTLKNIRNRDKVEKIQMHNYKKKGETK